MPYAEQDMVADSLYVADDDRKVDEQGVVYTKNGKRLLFAGGDFKPAEYHVPDGVVTICNLAFSSCEQHVTLHVPQSVKVIGSDLFGNGGGAIVRDS